MCFPPLQFYANVTVVCVCARGGGVLCVPLPRVSCPGPQLDPMRLLAVLASACVLAAVRCQSTTLTIEYSVPATMVINPCTSLPMAFAEYAFTVGTVGPVTAFATRLPPQVRG